ncbi:hypothetical protein DIE23_29970 [Burkholderia sp. Bp9143]|uniref:hypothetical protein n=1 Tax=Burkholderia sp. Bp9143 TaxID=2184574 RepID=UPI000F5B36DC|nr:hypothetical protein [Burkholderia sp. Bp9143]RQR26328.1 hypothetical protein DIE23_29970 [Burkholderia sp. Bp9143]
MFHSMSHPRKLGSIAFVASVTSVVWCLLALWGGQAYLYAGVILAATFALVLDFIRRKKIERIERELESANATSVRRIFVNEIQVGTLPAREVAELKLRVALDPAVYVSQFLAVGKTLLHGAVVTAIVVPLAIFWRVVLNVWIDPHHAAQTVSILSSTVQSLANHGALQEMFELFAQATQRCVVAIWMLATAVLTIFWPAKFIPNTFRNRLHRLLRQRVNCAVDGATQVRNH